MFITFYDLRAAMKARSEMSEEKLNGRRLDVHYAIPKTKRDEDDENHGTVFVALDDSKDGVIDPAELRALVEGWGLAVRDVRAARGSQARFVECWDLRHSEQLVREKSGVDYRGGKLKFKHAHLRPR